jgi:hypothetical protein
VQFIDPDSGSLAHEVAMGRGPDSDRMFVSERCLFQTDQGRWCLALLDREGMITILDVGEGPPHENPIRSAVKLG